MGGSDPTRRPAERAASQRGNVTREQLRELGWSDDQIDRRVGWGWLIRRHAGVFALGHVPRTRESRWHAAVLTIGAGAVLSHRSAGAHWGILKGAAPTEVTLSSMLDRRGRDGILVHRQGLPSEHVTTRDGIPVTTLLRTVLDLAAVLPTRRLARAFSRRRCSITSRRRLSPPR